ncbi:hypothetical protein ID850_14590 [Xenorhabdus sp. Flor]|uniref:hypothetical protein n=1 Tax=Xenorhabdus cabanillasii TaxID=351673 RepID=UPI0019A44426|nr:hypothetical protein [Xenorhabdus sp. Flor]MBD2815964.1 hypothetical protein [Xenorhabdus sp. Flor]
MAKHPYADLIMAYAKYAQETESPWEYFQYRIGDNDKWMDCSAALAFRDVIKYRLKPRTIRIGNYDVPEPLRVTLEEDDEYFYVDTGDIYHGGGAGIAWWMNGGNDKSRLYSGLIHLARESAELHAKALISLTQNDTR